MNHYLNIFCGIDEKNEDAITCRLQSRISSYRTWLNVLYIFLDNILFGIQTKSLELQQHYTSITHLYRLITTLLKTLFTYFWCRSSYARLKCKIVDDEWKLSWYCLCLIHQKIMNKNNICLFVQ